ncbi:hypothetical protein N8I74_14105 [Chitiniphilus purpureus]|uniref:Uncharacterized protein n=1 Tax=Chitiniphilus purpureus TaxID=2981137 RepID=A0ABY6DJD5_9NEIS|nr:hypothetical protein [Chitiniphilus sp. CD1]UXY14442.1 hypothetical protein N8I74_14105 [Chitiniphilus sp. CD1]
MDIGSLWDAGLPDQYKTKSLPDPLFFYGVVANKRRLPMVGKERITAGNGVSKTSTALSYLCIVP